MDINELTLEAIKNYYKVIKKKGSINDSQLYKLLLLSFINDLFQEEYSWFITEKDYAMLTGIGECISKDACIVPYNSVAIHIEPIKNYLEDTPVRISEDAELRSSQEGIIRLSEL